MATNIVVGKHHEFEFVQSSTNFRDFFFNVLTNGENIGHKIIVHLYGGISIPPQSGISLTAKDRNKLAMFAVMRFKTACYF